MEHNAPETDFDLEYFKDYPYTVEIFYGNTCEDIYRTDNLSTAQAKFDKWAHDLSVVNNHTVKMFKFNAETEVHNLIDYNGNIIEE